jgi:hypothetical protein
VLHGEDSSGSIWSQQGASNNKLCLHLSSPKLALDFSVGRVADVVQNVTVMFDDNAKCKIKRVDPGYLIPICYNLIEDENFPYYQDQRVRGNSSAFFQNAQWL